MNTNEWEERTHLMLSRAKALDVLANVLTEFTEKFGSTPDIIFFHPSCRTALTVEIMEATGATADCAVAEPFWLGGVPILYNSKVCGESYLVLRSLYGKKELRL